MHQTEGDRAPSPEEIRVDEVTEALAAPFQRGEVKFRPGATSGNRALALGYVDARAIQDRLDDVLGVAGWQDEYECLPDGSVVCRLRLRLGTEWITKMDVGSPSEQPDEGDRRKAAFSDALKRAAVKFGIGRYLYRLPVQWVDFDPKKRHFTATPALPKEALPRPRELPALGNGRKPEAPAAEKTPPVRLAASEPKNAPALPANGAELQRRLYDYDARLTRQGVCEAGALVKHIVESGVKAGFERDLATWSGPAILLAVEETKAFEAQARKAPKAKGTKQKDVA